MYLRSVFVKGHEYLLLVENRRENGKIRQRVIRYFGRRDRMDVEQLQQWLKILRGEIILAEPSMNVSTLETQAAATGGPPVEVA